MCSGIVFEMRQYQLTKPQAPKLRAHIHPLDLPVLRAKQFDAATACRCPLVAQQEKSHRLRDELLDTESVTAFGGIERRKMRFELSNQGDGVGGVGAFRRD